MLYKGKEAKEYVFQETGETSDFDAVLIVRSIYGNVYEGLMKDGCLIGYLSSAGNSI